MPQLRSQSEPSSTSSNMNAKVLSLLVVLVAAVSADRRPYAYGGGSSEESFESSEAKYDFQWAVRDDSSGNDFGHQENRDGDHTQGSYYVQLPDGRLQKVSYFVDGNSGYVAEVSYEGQARYPDSYESFESFESRESPRYAPPRPSYG